jgi:hypothetical protein
MSLHELTGILSSPESPREAHGDWQAIERTLGATLPTDYHDFIEAFGSGKIDDFIVILNPFSSNRFNNLVQRANRDMDDFRQSKSKFPQYYPHDVFPNPGGLLPVGSTDNGDLICWETKGPSDEWSIVVYDTRAADHSSHDGPITNFITALLNTSVRCPVFPRDFPSNSPSFTPAGQVNCRKRKGTGFARRGKRGRQRQWNCADKCIPKHARVIEFGNEERQTELILRQAQDD